MDEFLFRHLKKGSQYQSLFPSSACERVVLGKGDTDYSIEKMVEWILENQHQTLKVSKLLEKSSLQDTCLSIHDFLYWHFQYKADLSDQLLRSPACAWKQRVDGIDCKSYSIIASSILLNLGINHYIRKVAYTAPDEFTHVYVIVPKNQQTNNLDDGYYMIDGTINTMEEPYYLEAKDEFMSGLSHFGLQRPHSKLNAGQVLAVFKKLNLNDLKSKFGWLSCIGGTAFDTATADQTIGQGISLLNNLVAQINLAIINRDMAALKAADIKFKGTAAILFTTFILKNNQGWNQCSSRNFDYVIQTFQAIAQKIAFGLLNEYYKKYFITSGSSMQYFSTSNVQLWNLGVGFTDVEDWGTNIQSMNFVVKIGITDIPAFEFTPEVTGVLNNTSTVQQALGSLITTASTVVTASNTNANTNAGGTYQTDSTTDTGSDQGTPKDKPNSGIGTAATVGLVGLSIWGISKLFSKSKNKANAK